jgi:hypothetical protein
MTRKMKISMVIFLLSIGLASITVAQEPTVMEEEKRSDGSFANLFHFTFKPGKTDEGLEILRTTLLPSFSKANIKVTLIEDLMGTKDIMLIIPLEQGPSYYEYVMPAQDQRLWTSLLYLAGSPEKAEANLDRFIGLLEKQSQTMVFLPRLE